MKGCEEKENNNLIETFKLNKYRDGIEKSTEKTGRPTKSLVKN